MKRIDPAFTELLVAAIPFLAANAGNATAEARARLRAAVQRAACSPRVWPGPCLVLLQEAGEIVHGTRRHLAAGTISRATDGRWGAPPPVRSWQLRPDVGDGGRP